MPVQNTATVATTVACRTTFLSRSPSMPPTPLNMMNTVRACRPTAGGTDPVRLHAHPDFRRAKSSGFLAGAFRRTPAVSRALYVRRFACWVGAPRSSLPPVDCMGPLHRFHGRRSDGVLPCCAAKSCSVGPWPRGQSDPPAIVCSWSRLDSFFSLILPPAVSLSVASLSREIVAVATARVIDSRRESMSTVTKQAIRRVDREPAAENRPATEDGTIAPAGRGWRINVGHVVPNLIVFSLLAGVLCLGHHTGWKMPKLRGDLGHVERDGRRLVLGASGAGIAMCRMPGRTAAQARPVRLLPAAWRCRVRHLSSRVCRGQPAAAGCRSTIPRRRLRSMARPENNSRNTLHKRRVQFAGEQSAAKAGDRSRRGRKSRR